MTNAYPRTKSVAARWPTKRARELADAAIDALPETAPMTEYIDTWLATYKQHGGIEKR